MNSSQFRPDGKTLRRWRRTRRGTAWLALPFVALICIELLAFRGWDLFAYVVLTSAGGLTAAASYWSLTRRVPLGATWSGYGMLGIADLIRGGLARDVVGANDLRSRPRRVVGGRLTTRPAGLVLSLGISSRFAGYKGSIVLPWDKILSIEIGTIPRALVRGMTIGLIGGTRVECRFFGCTGNLAHAIGSFWSPKNTD